MCKFYREDGYFCRKGMPLMRGYQIIICRERPERFPLSFMELNQPGYLNVLEEEVRSNIERL